MLTTKRLTVTGLLISLSLILSRIEIPFFSLSGGSITLFSMVPILIISFKYSYKWGTLSGVMFGILHFITTSTNFRGLNIHTIFLSVFLDYILAYSIIGFSSFFLKLKINNLKVLLTISTIISFVLKYILHVISGILIWNSFFSSFLPSFIYSISYNAFYIIPETIITIIGILSINKIFPQIFQNK